MLLILPFLSLLVAYRTERADCTVHQTAHREDADQEAGKSPCKMPFEAAPIFGPIQNVLSRWVMPQHPGYPLPAPHLPLPPPLEMTIDLGPAPNAQML